MLKGLGTRLRVVQTHLWNAGESCADPLPLSLTWGYRWLVRWGLLLCFPKHAQTSHITLKPILQTLTTRVWMVSRSNGLDGTNLFHKIPSNLSKVIFPNIWSHCFFCSTSGKGFWQAHPSWSWTPSFRNAPTLKDCPTRWTLSRAMKHSKKFPSVFVWRVPYVIQYSNTSASKEEGTYAYYLGVGGKSHLWSYAS